MSARASGSFASFCALAACAALGACAHGGGDRAVAGMSASDLPELGEAYSATAATYRVSPHGYRQNVKLTLNSPVAEICANPAGKAVLDNDLPGLTSRPEYMFFKHMSLKKLKDMSGGKLTDADLAKVAAELAKLGPNPGYESEQ